MKDKKGSRIWVGISNQPDEIPYLIEQYKKEQSGEDGNFDNAAVIVGSTLSFEECVQLENVFDFVVKLGDQTPEEFNLLLWDHVTLRMGFKKNGIIPHHQTNGHVSTLSDNNEPIAIVGVSCRLPGANDTATFWDNLLHAKNSLGPAQERWRLDQGCSNLTPEHEKTEAGFLSCPVDTFDSEFWGLSPLELSFTDPQARMLLQLSWEALEDAGILPSSLHGTTASIYLGLWRDEYKDLILMSGSTAGGEELRRYLGCSMGNAAARIAHALGTLGPAFATETGCSSSMCSIGQAMAALREGKTNLALAGGANLLLKPFVYPDFQGVLSPSGRCKVFQADGDGFARAEGAIFYVLKRASDAIADGNHIYGFLRGFGSSQEGLSRSVGTPTIEGEARAMTAALKNTGVRATSVDWVEMHGTGTKVGDPIEMASTRSAYSAGSRDSPLILTSVKANIGHTESVSGAAGLLKVILAMENGTIPPQLLTSDLNPKLDLEGVEIPKEPMPWAGKMAGVSSFGITGTNAHLIVERGSLTFAGHDHIDENPCPAYILPLSAKTQKSLEEMKKRHVHALQNLDDSSLGSYCYTASISRTHFQSPYRSAVVASSKDELIDALLSNNTFEIEQPTPPPESLCFLFPGQGCQYTGMGRGLYESCAVFRRHFDIVNSLLTTKYGINLKTLLFEGTEVSLYSQLCIFGVEYSLLKVWAAWGLTPSLVLGHSFGEFAASCAAGALSLPTALELLIAMRTKLFGRVNPGKMLVLKADRDSTDKLITDFLSSVGDSNNNNWLDIAGINSAEQTVVSSEPETICAFATYATSVGVKNTAVSGVSHAFHSRALESIGDQFELEAGTLSYSKRFPQVKYISSVEGRLLESEEKMGAIYWRKHMRQAVEFVNASKAAVEHGGRMFVEVGPHPLLSPLVSKNAPAVSTDKLVCIPSMRKGAPELITLLEAVASLYVNGVDFQWEKVWCSLGNFTKLHKILPIYPFECREAFWFTSEEEESSKKLIKMPNHQFGNVIHPLLGSVIETPLPDAHLFVTTTKGLLQRAGVWLQDHKLGNFVIFPAAGYVEMTFAAVAHVHPSVKVEGLEILNLEIKAALPLELEAEIQTVLQELDSELIVSFFSRKEDGPWKLHAKANIEFCSEDDRKEIIVDLREENDGELVTNLYHDMARLGYNFGKSFQTLDKLMRSKDSSVACELSNYPADNCSYFLHPTIIDALIQALLLTEPLISLKLPTRIASLKLFPLVHNDQALRVETKTGCARLLAGTEEFGWSELASISTLATVSTTLSIFQQAAGLVSKPKLLPLYVEEWSETESILESNLNNNISSNESKLASLVTNNVLPFSLTKDEADSLDMVEAYVCRGVVCALRQLGWNYAVGSTFAEKDLYKTLQIRAAISPQFLHRLLHYAKQAGFLKFLSESQSWQVACDFTECENSDTNLVAYINTLPEEWSFAKFYSAKLPNLLSSLAKESVLPHLFPANALQAPYSATQLYSTFTQSTGLLANLTSVFKTFAHTYKGRQLRILEVGAGTGCATRRLLQILNGSSTSYTFSDISPAFLTMAEACYHGNQWCTVPGVNVDFRVLDLEKDPISQNFVAGSYDVIVALNVLHATIDVEEVCKNMRLLLRPHGNLLVAEQHKPTALVDIVFGHCEGYWRFQDAHRSDHCLLEKEGWERVLDQAGYGQTLCVESKDIGMGVIIATNKGKSVTNWVMIGDDNELGEKLGQVLDQGGVRLRLEDPLPTEIVSMKEQQFIFIVPQHSHDNIDTAAFRPVLASFLRLAQSVKKGKLLIVTFGCAPIKDEEAVISLGGPILGMSRTLMNECPEVNVSWVDLDPMENEESRISEIKAELENGRERERFISYRGGVRYLAKLVPMQASLDLCVPEGHVQLKLPESRSIADVEWMPAPQQQRRSSCMGGNDVKVQILASGLNFKDLLNIMKPTPEFFNASGVGADFCGKIVSLGSSVSTFSLGDSVLGMNPIASPLPNYVTLDASLVAKLPQNYTHTEGATLPTAFLTAYHCLVTVGKLKAGECALIHTASGAVGLAAIQVARGLGARVICTAGSKRKRAYLRSLGLRNVFNSRDLSYADGVMAATSGSGVDLVLNSLTSKGWKEASLGVTKKRGRFIEMSKLNIWTREEVANLRPDITYSVEDLSIADYERGAHLAKVMNEWLADGRLQPIRHTVFRPSEITTALGQLERALHIGKVVIGWEEMLFNDRSSYLITGGSGALGLEVAKWILSSGGKHVILASRRSHRVEEALHKLKTEFGLNVDNVVIREIDVADASQVAQLVDDISLNYAPIRGVFHAAGVLSDGTLPTQTMTKMETVFSGKVDGAWALHSSTQHLLLEHFVLFSSAMWQLGGPGQVNYTAANAALASLAEHRHRLGLPATCVAWGHWGDVGMAAESGRRIFGVEPFSTDRGILTLEHLLRNGNSARNVMAAELSSDVCSGWLKEYVELGEESGNVGKSAEMESSDNDESSIEVKVRNVVQRILRTKVVLEGKRELRAMGMDSLMFIELKNRLQTSVGVVIEIPDTATVDDLIVMVTKAKAST